MNVEFNGCEIKYPCGYEIDIQEFQSYCQPTSYLFRIIKDSVDTGVNFETLSEAHGYIENLLKSEVEV